MGKSKIWMIFDIVINVLLVILLTTSIILTLSLSKDEIKDYKDELTALRNWKLCLQETTDFEECQAGFEIELLNRQLSISKRFKIL